MDSWLEASVPFGDKFDKAVTQLLTVDNSLFTVE